MWNASSRFDLRKLATWIFYYKQNRRKMQLVFFLPRRAPAARRKSSSDPVETQRRAEAVAPYKRRVYAEKMR